MNLQQRVINILTKPQEEWPIIAAEATDESTLYKNYIFVLAAIGPACSIIGTTLFTAGFGLIPALVAGVLGFVLTLVGVFLAAIVIEKLAGSFQSQGNRVQALKLVAYSYTPMWVAGVLQLIPLLGILALLAGLYGIYLFYLGMPPVLQTPDNQRIPFMIVAAILLIIIQFFIFFVTAAIVAAMVVGTAIVS